MPRFFFDFFDGQSWSADEHGLDLDSAEQAYLEAFAGARSMWAELSDGHRDPSACAFEVKGTDGKAVLRFDFAELLGKREPPARPDLPHSALVRTLDETHRHAENVREDFKACLDQVSASLDESFRLVARLGAFRGGAPRRAGDTGRKSPDAA
jgi:hypothetical protein